ncbi:MAG: hypothetical protein ACPGID_12450, partial [Rubricella sp.]
MIRGIVARQLSALEIARHRPLLIVDADEVLVHFLCHFRDWLPTRGWQLDLSDYSLDTALVDRGTGRRGSRDDALAEIDAFFASETQRQKAIPGAARALARLSSEMQIVILTNLPHA